MRNDRHPLRSRPVVVLLVAQSLASTGGAAVFGFLPLYAEDRYQADILTASLTLCGFWAAAAIASLVSGELADRHGRRPIIELGLSLGAVAAIALWLVPSLPFLVVAVAVFGFFDSLSLPAAQAVVADVLEPDERKAIYGRMYQAQGLGWFVGSAVAGILIGRFGFASAYILAASMMLVAASLVMGWLPETKPVAHHLPAHEEETESERQADAFGMLPLQPPVSPVPEHSFDRRSEGRARSSSIALWWLADKRLLVLTLLYLATAGAYLQLFTVFPAEGLTRNGLGPVEWGGILALNGAMIIAAQGLVSRLVRTLHPLRAIAAGLVLWTGGFAALSLLAGPGWVTAEMVVFTIGEMVIFPLQPSLVSELARPKERARYQGALAMGGSVGNTLAPAVAGIGITAVGPLWWLASAGGCCLLVAAYLRTALVFNRPSRGRTKRSRPDGVAG